MATRLTCAALAVMLYCATTSSALAQTTDAQDTPPNGASEEARTDLTFDLLQEADGSFRLVRRGDAEQPAPGVPEGAQVEDGSQLTDAFTALERGVEIRPIIEGTAFNEALVSQDWYMVTGPAGTPQKVYALPPGEPLPADTFSKLAVGASVQKITAPSWVNRLALNREELKAILELLMAEARAAVCDMSGRPSSFGTAVDVSAGIGIQGRVAFNAEWLTVDLCR